MSGRGNLLAFFKKNIASNASASDSGIDANQSKSTSSSHKPEGASGNESELSATFNDMSLSTSRSHGPGLGRGNLVRAFRSSPQDTIGSISTSSTSTEASKDISAVQEEMKTKDNPKKVEKSSFVPAVIHGAAVNVACNYIHLKSDPNKGVFIYEVRFSPSVDSMQLRNRYLKEHKEKIGGVHIYDGSNLCLPIQLKDNLTTFISKSSDNADIEIRLLFKKKEALKNCLQLYNVLFNRVMRTLNFVRFDRKHFDPTCPKIIPLAKLEVWPGYVTAVDEYEGGLMLCCDVSHRLLCQKTVLEMLIEIYQQNRNSFQDNAKKSLIGSIVITRYNNRTYKIDDISFSESPQSLFETRTGSFTYLEYYKTHYNINIRDIKQPLLISVKKCRGDLDSKDEEMRFCLIPELCYLTGLQDEIRSDTKLMREIAASTAVTPNQRVMALEKFIQNINQCSEARQILQSWGLSLLDVQSMTGRKMDPEQIKFGKRSVLAGPNADFSRDATNNEVLQVVHLRNWILIHYRNDSKSVNTLTNNMERCCQAFGMNYSKPMIISLDNDRLDAYVGALRRNITSETQIVVCICPSSRDDRYNAIKKICCVELPIPSQVINARTLYNENRNRSIVQMIILQMNCKMGGSLWSVKIPFEKVMICGIDSYHDPGQKNNSVAAFVASLNSSYSQWYSKAVIQSKKEELVNGLTSAFESALECYKSRNGTLPTSVIIYRDGVGDGQFNICSSYEVPQFEAVNKNIKITFIVVQKRHNTRFFATNGTNFSNPLPGTVIDKCITRSHMYDFFLVSQMVRQGTVSPVHYVVLRDDGNYGPDIVQRLTYKLCFLYYNWPGTVRVPACCLYAHKLVYLIGQSVQRMPASSLDNKLFYL